MAKIIKDVATVECAADGLLLIRHERLWSDGDQMGGDFVFEADAAGWLAERIEAAADSYSVPDVEQAMPPDHFLVFARGGEHGEDPNVHVHNRRDPLAPRGKTYTISGMAPETARELVCQLARTQAVAPLSVPGLTLFRELQEVYISIIKVRMNPRPTSFQTRSNLW